MKRRPSEWLKIVKMHVDDGVPMTKLAEKYNFNVSRLKHKVIVSVLKTSPLKYKDKILQSNV